MSPLENKERWRNQAKSKIKHLFRGIVKWIEFQKIRIFLLSTHFSAFIPEDYFTTESYKSTKQRMENSIISPLLSLNPALFVILCYNIVSGYRHQRNKEWRTKINKQFMNFIVSFFVYQIYKDDEEGSCNLQVLPQMATIVLIIYLQLTRNITGEIFSSDWISSCYMVSKHVSHV